MSSASLKLVAGTSKEAYRIAKRMGKHQRRALCELDNYLAAKDDLEARKGELLMFSQIRKKPHKLWRRLCELGLILITRHGGEYAWHPKKKAWTFHSGSTHMHLHITRLGKSVAGQIRAHDMPRGSGGGKGIPLHEAPDP